MTWLIGLPRWVQGLGGLALIGAAALLWLHFHDRKVVREHEAKVTEAVASASASASAAAIETATAKQTEVENTNDQARTAAAAGDDPLGDGLRSLRQARGADRPASR